MADESISRKSTGGGSRPLDTSSPRRRSANVGGRRGASSETGPTPTAPTEPADPEAVRPLDRTERVARRAYERYEARGGTGGDELQDWLEAERQIDAEDAGTDRE